MAIEHKAFQVELKANADKREIEGYAALFDVKDHGDDVILKGAFQRTLKDHFSAPGGIGRNRVKVLWHHQKLEPIGRPLALSEDAKGLHFKARLTKGVQRADEVLALVADDVVDQMSFGFDTLQSEMGDWKAPNSSPEEDGKRVRFLKELALWEISPVTWGMNDATEVGMAKAMAFAQALEAVEEGKASSEEVQRLMKALDYHQTRLAELLAKMGGGNSGKDRSQPEAAGELASLERVLAETEKWITQKRGSDK